jgi:UDP-N-acetylglucosamine 2-epimerase
VKGFLSGVRKVACPHENETLFAGSSSSGSKQNQLLGHVEAEGSSQQRRPVPEVLHNIFT